MAPAVWNKTLVAPVTPLKKKNKGQIMSARTTETTITFRHPFKLSSFDRQQPAGTYRVVIDEEEILGLSFVAYQRMATMLHTPALAVVQGAHEVFQISSSELETALEADARVEPYFS